MKTRTNNHAGTGRFQKNGKSFRRRHPSTNPPTRDSKSCDEQTPPLALNSLYAAKYTFRPAPSITQWATAGTCESLNCDRPARNVPTFFRPRRRCARSAPANWSAVVRGVARSILALLSCRRLWHRNPAAACQSQSLLGQRCRYRRHQARLLRPKQRFQKITWNGSPCSIRSEW
jgi:hypothetical protein